MGHQFDYYYGTSQEYKKQYTALLDKYPKAYDGDVDVTPTEEAFFSSFMDNNGLSDKPEFKNALLKDLQNLNAKDLNLDEGYFVAEFYNRGLDIKPNKNDIQQGDCSRSEIFAQLFAYEMGAEDKHKEKFLKIFKNTCKVVHNYVTMFSK